MTADGREPSLQARFNAEVWRAGRYLSQYDRRDLHPAEALMLARHREHFSRRVLDVGCGAGRILRYLVALGADAHGVDISPRMVEHCRALFPALDIRIGDVRSLPESAHGAFDVVLLSDNLLDVLDDAERRSALADIRGLLAEGGLLVFSSHNLWARDHRGSAPGERRAGRLGLLLDRPPRWTLRAIGGLPRRRANRRLLGPHQSRAVDHAIVNDAAHDYSLLHYYISRGAQERQLAQLGLRLIEVLEFDGTSVPAGADGRGGSLYYVATPTG